MQYNDSLKGKWKSRYLGKGYSGFMSKTLVPMTHLKVGFSSHLCHSHALCDHLSDVCQVMYSGTVTVQCTVARWLLGPRRGESRKYSWMPPPLTTPAPAILRHIMGPMSSPPRVPSHQILSLNGCLRTDSPVDLYISFLSK